MGERTKNVIVEDEEDAKPEQMDNVQKINKEISPVRAFIFPVTK